MIIIMEVPWVVEGCNWKMAAMYQVLLEHQLQTSCEILTLINFQGLLFAADFHLWQSAMSSFHFVRLAK